MLGVGLPSLPGCSGGIGGNGNVGGISEMNTSINLSDAVSMECSLSFLTCGYNATGNSAVVTIEKVKKSGEKKICDRIFFNVGDSTQRFCSEHRVKFEAVSTIVITSLAPHNIAGFAGVFLSLSDKGAEELKVVGPSGVKLMLDMMMPFINRRFPKLICFEIEDEETEIESIGGYLKAMPVFADGLSRKSVAIAVSFVPKVYKLPKQSSADWNSHRFSFLPIPCQFKVNHSLSEMMQWSKEWRNNNTNNNPMTSNGKDIAVFIPIGSASHISESLSLDYGQSLSVFSLDDSSLYSVLSDVCKAEDTLGFVYSGNLSKTCIEFQHTQITIQQLEMVCKPLFPNSLRNSAPLSGEYIEKINYEHESILHVYPLLEVRYVLTPHQSLIAGDYEGSFGVQHGMRLDAFVQKLQQRLAITETYKHSVLSSIATDDHSLSTSITTNDNLDPLESPHLSSLAEEFNLRSTLNRDHKVPFWQDRKPSLQENTTTKVITTEIKTVTNKDNKSVADSIRNSLLGKHKLSSQSIQLQPLPSLDEGDNSKMICGTPVSAMPSCMEVSNKAMNEQSNNGLEVESAAQDAPKVRKLEHFPSYDRKNRWSPLALDNANNSFAFPDAPSSSANDRHLLDLTCIAGVPPPNPNQDSFIIALLGTGCATPSKHRSNSCIFLSLLQKKKRVIVNAPPMILNRAPPPPSLTLPVPEVNRKKTFGLSLDLMLCTGDRPNDTTKPITNIEPENAVKKRPGLSLDLTLCNNNSHKRKRSDEEASAPPSLDQLPSELDETMEQEEFGDGQNENKEIGCSVILDIGEGTCSQLFQSVGGDVERYDELLLNIKLVWISHHHADHATGFPMLMEQINRAKIRKEQYCPPLKKSTQSALDFDRYIPTYDKFHLRKIDFNQNKGYESEKITLVANEVVLKYCHFALAVAGLDDFVNFYSITNTLYAGATSDMQLLTHGLVRKLVSVAVSHCQNAYGMVLELAEGQKIVYSGDCRPSQSLVKSGINCHLLIHEATFDDDRIQDAYKKKHSTISEAVSIARKMNAKHTILTHFSQRYPKSLDLSAISVPSAPASVASSRSSSIGNIFSTGSSSRQNFGNRQNSIAVFTPSPSMESEQGLALDVEDGPTMAELEAAGEINVSMSYDLIRIAYPSQIVALPNATKEIAKSFAFLEDTLARNNKTGEEDDA